MRANACFQPRASRPRYLLDKGIVVVGHPGIEQAFYKLPFPGFDTVLKGGEIVKAVRLVLILLGVELVREVFVLNALGFEPGRFVNWIRSDEIA